MFEKIGAIWGLFRKGEMVDDPEKWKNRQIHATVLAGVIMAAVAAAKAFGYDLPVDNDTALAIAGGIIAVVNVVLTYTTSKTVGLPANSKPIDYSAPEEPRNDR